MQPPQEAIEPTSTLALTSYGQKYVTDVRVLDPSLPPASPSSFPALPSPTISSTPTKPRQPPLEWAFAGTSESTAATDPNNGKAVTKTRWMHWIDSKTNNPDEVEDEGDMYTLASGEVLEKGTSTDPRTGAVRDMEELWRDLDVEAVPALSGMYSPTTPTGGSSKGFNHNTSEASSQRLSFVLRAENLDLYTRGLIVRVGGWCQGVLKVGPETSAERWRYVKARKGSGGVGGKEGWERVVKVGDGSLPCAVMWERDNMSVGEEVRSGGLKWEVVEHCLW